MASESEENRRTAEVQQRFWDEHAVNSPDHYNGGGVETIDGIRAALGDEAFLAYCRGNALKYIWRAPLKGKPIEDLHKAIWYLRMAAGDDPRLEPIDAPRERPPA